MADEDEGRIAAKAHELWEAEGRPDGRAERHWAQAREIVALEAGAGASPGAKADKDKSAKKKAAPKAK